MNPIKLKLLYTLALLLCMSTFASSNECARNCHRTTTAGKADNTGKITDLPASASSLVTDRDKATTSEDNGSAGEDKAYALTLIKLLYI